MSASGPLPVIDEMLAERLLTMMLLAPDCKAADGRPSCSTCGRTDNLVLWALPAGEVSSCGSCGRLGALVCSSPAFGCRDCLERRP